MIFRYLLSAYRLISQEREIRSLCFGSHVECEFIGFVLSRAFMHAGTYLRDSLIAYVLLILIQSVKDSMVLGFIFVHG